MKSNLFLFYKNIISGSRKGIIASCVRAVLYVLSGVYFCALFVRKMAYRLNLRTRFRPKAFVISIGNITAGGTGKTPFTMYLAEKLAYKRPAILLRGYKSAAESDGCITKVAQESTVSQVGDEACLIKKRLPAASIYVGKNKVEAAKLAISNGAEVLLVDDGMQHMPLDRDVNICLIDALNPFGYGYLLPRGLLREPLDGLKRADLVVITRAMCPTDAIEKTIKQYTDAPVAKAVTRIDGIYTLLNEPLHLSAGSKVALFSGIGNPQAFYEMVQSAGFEVVAAQELLDHDVMNDEEFSTFAAHSMQKGAVYLLCTEKDAVKMKVQKQASVAYIRVTMEIISGETTLISLLALN